MSQLDYTTPSPPEKPPVRTSTPPPKPRTTLALKTRVVSSDELYRMAEQNPKLGYYDLIDILARINKKDARYIKEDMQEGRPMKVPVDFSSYQRWSPLPSSLPGNVEAPKLILVVKDIPFVAWYENGKMKGDSLTCVGKEWNWTQKGIYKVLEKDPDHYSKSYTNAYGEPAWMPMALRIYGTVWIHAGDVVGPFCSHGCINLPMKRAEVLYGWAELGTPVVICDYSKDIFKDLMALYPTEIREPVIVGPSVR